MAWHFPPYLLILLTGVVLALTFAVLIGRRYPAAGSRPAILLMLALAEWQALRLLEGAATATTDKILWAKWEYLGIASVPPLWFLLTWEYGGRALPRRVLALLWVVPALTVLAALTNEWHRLIWTRVTRLSPAPDALPIYEHGPWFWFFVAYGYCLMLLGTATLVRTITRFPAFYRRQSVALIVAAAVPWLANVLYLTRSGPVPGLDLTPFAFTLSGSLIFWALFRSQLFNLVPIARGVLIERMADGVLVLDTSGRIVDSNSAARHLLAAAEPLTIGVPVADALQELPDLVALLREHPLDRENADHNDAHAELRVGEARYLDVRLTPLVTDRGELRGRLVQLRDITITKQAEVALRATNIRLQEQLSANRELQTRLVEEAIRDPLTGLFNRRYLWEVLAQELTHATQNGQPVSVVLIDLDHFKRVNDRHGHAAGDWLLGAVGELLRSRTRTSDIVCRYGGEEFAAVLPGADSDTACARAEQWRQALQDLHVHRGNMELRVTLSAGVATFPTDGTERDSLLDAADRALYAAKAAGRNRVEAHTALAVAD